MIGMSEKREVGKSMSFEEMLKHFMKESNEHQKDNKDRQNKNVRRKPKKLPTHGLEDT